ncbi:MAG: hypothetical protein WD335_02245 [Candidatus Paceibacterota bacterium]
MMTLYLAQFLGVLYFVISLAILIDRRKVRAMLMSLKESNGAFFVMGTVVFSFGLLLTLLHNDWKSFHGFLVGIIAWGAVVESLLYLFLPHRSLVTLINSIDNDDVITASSIVGMGLGIALFVSSVALF